MTDMRVKKRDGRFEAVQFDKITHRLSTLRAPHGTEGRHLDVDVTRVAAQVCAAIRDGISTVRLDELAADTAAGMGTEHPDYGLLAARILISNLQKHTSESVADTFEAMQPVLDPGFLAAVRRHRDELQGMVAYDRDYDYDFFGFKTMERMYLGRVAGRVVERPQHMWLRVALALWPDDMDRVRQTYEHLSTGKFTHASPTLFNAGHRHQQLASCFLAGIEDDSIDGIFDAVTKCAKISKYGGGIGLHVSGVRGKGAPIKGTNGQSDGLVPMLRVMNAVAGYVNQVGSAGSGFGGFARRRRPPLCAPQRPRRAVGHELRARGADAWLRALLLERAHVGGDPAEDGGGRGAVPAALEVQDEALVPVVVLLLRRPPRRELPPVGRHLGVVPRRQVQPGRVENAHHGSSAVHYPPQKNRREGAARAASRCTSSRTTPTSWTCWR